jgi:hypothetical protein
MYGCMGQRIEKADREKNKGREEVKKKNTFVKCNVCEFVFLQTLETHHISDEYF